MRSGPDGHGAGRARLHRPGHRNADAVRRTHADGGPALVRSVFDRVPREGHWRTALLMDGNVGIGGAPGALLTRLRRLLRPGGTLIVETAAGPPDRDERLHVRLHDGARAHGPHFPWAVLGPDALERHAGAAGWTMTASWTTDGRIFTSLHTPGASRWRVLAEPGQPPRTGGRPGSLSVVSVSGSDA
jgi:hypothetical protein